MRFQPKYTPEDIFEMRALVDRASSKSAGYDLAAAAFDTTANAVRHRLRNAYAGERRRTLSRELKGRTHIVIGDTQVKPGISTDHLEWIGRFIADKYAGDDVAIVHVGDHWDMPSLSSYDRGKRSSEGRRYAADVAAGNEAFGRLNKPIAVAMAAHKWRPERHFLFGNHEDRITRACEDAGFLDGKLSLDDLDTHGWTRHEFLKPVNIDGVRYCHYFYNPKTGRPYAGDNMDLRLKTIGHTFTQGHQQGKKYAVREVDDQRHHGLQIGSTYVHDEKYLGPQSMKYWRGIVVCHQVEAGQYDAMFVSLDYLCRRYEGKKLKDFVTAA